MAIESVPTNSTYLHRDWLARFAIINVFFMALLVNANTVDYYGFYSVGRLAAASPNLLYNEAAQHAFQGNHRVLLPFLHLPHACQEPKFVIFAVKSSPHSKYKSLRNVRLPILNLLIYK